MFVLMIKSLSGLDFKKTFHIFVIVILRHEYILVSGVKVGILASSTTCNNTDTDTDTG